MQRRRMGGIGSGIGDRDWCRSDGVAFHLGLPAPPGRQPYLKLLGKGDSLPRDAPGGMAMIAFRNILHGYSVATRAGRLRVMALAALAIVGVVGSYTLDLARSPSDEGGSADGSLGADGNSAGGGLGDGPLAQDGVGGADPGSGVAAGQALASQTSTGSSSRSGTGSSSGSGAAGASGGSSSSSSTSSATSTSTSSSTSSTSSSSSGSPTDGLAPDLGDGFGTGGLVNEDQFVNDIQQVSETVTSTASSVVGGVGGLPGP